MNKNYIKNRPEKPSVQSEKLIWQTYLQKSYSTRSFLKNWLLQINFQILFFIFGPENIVMSWISFIERTNGQAAWSHFSLLSTQNLANIIVLLQRSIAKVLCNKGRFLLAECELTRRCYHRFTADLKETKIRIS